MRRRSLLLLAWGFMFSASPVFGAAPSVDRVDYGKPDQYLAFPDSLGDRAAILAQASKLKGKSGLDTIHNVLAWMDQTLKYDGRKPYRWTTYDDVLRDKTYGGCADQGIVCGVLLKGAGIPVVWVKTMDVAWIWDFKKGRPFPSWSGHVFLEVFVDGKWSLLDPGAKTLYQNYTPKMRILPGQRFAYDKGDDPKAMIMSTQWEEWKQQTAAYFRQLDETLLPVDEKDGASLVRQAYVIGNSPYYQALTAMAAESGLHVAHSFNTEYDRFLPQARGHVLLIECHRGKPIIPPAVLERYYPNALAGLGQPSKSIQIKDTLMVFVDFSEPLQAVGKGGLGSETGATDRTGSGVAGTVTVDGKPAANAEVIFSPTGKDDGAGMKTDETGGFAGSLKPGKYRVEIRPMGAKEQAEKKPTEPKAIQKGESVAGRIIFKGKPVSGAQIAFQPVGNGDAVAMPTDATGKFAGRLAAGQYHIAIRLLVEGRSVLPAKYGSPETSGLTVEVRPGPCVFDFDLQ